MRKKFVLAEFDIKKMAESPDNYWANIEAECNKLAGNWDGSGDTGFKQPKCEKDDDGFKLVSYRETNKTPKLKDKGLFGGSN